MIAVNVNADSRLVNGMYVNGLLNSIGYAPWGRVTRLSVNTFYAAIEYVKVFGTALLRMASDEMRRLVQRCRRWTPLPTCYPVGELQRRRYPDLAGCLYQAWGDHVCCLEKMKTKTFKGKVWDTRADAPPACNPEALFLFDSRLCEFVQPDAKFQTVTTRMLDLVPYAGTSDFKVHFKW